MKPKLLLLLRWAAVALIFFFLGKRVLADWRQVQQYDWSIHFFWLVFSLLLLLGDYFLLSWIWSEILKILGKNLKPRKAFRIFYLSNLARYLPGRIWQYVSLVAMCEKEGISKTTATASFVLSQLINLPAALLLILATGVFTDVVRETWMKDAVWILGGAITLGALVLIARPKLAEKALRYVLRRLQKNEPVLALKKTSFLGILFYYAFGWFLHGSAFFFLVVAVTGRTDHFFAMVGADVAAYLIGYLSFFTPAGLGVREAVLALILKIYFPESVAILVAAASRLWVILGETCGVAVTWKS